MIIGDGALSRMCAEQKNRCWYCRRLMDAPNGKTKLRATIEHRVPKARGGYGRHNKVAACLQCNSEKGPLTDLEFFALRKSQEARKRAVVYVNSVMQGGGRIEEFVCVRLALGEQTPVRSRESIEIMGRLASSTATQVAKVALTDSE